MPPRSVISVNCPNPSCEYYLKEEGKNIIRKGMSRSGRQEYLCLWCGTRFSENTNTPFHRMRMDIGDVHLICKMALDNNGARSIERLTGHRRETIVRLLGNLAENPGFCARFMLGSRKYEMIQVHELIRILSSRFKRQSESPARAPKKKELVEWQSLTAISF